MRAGQQSFADFIQAHYTAALAVNIKYTLLLSRMKYDRLRKLLSSFFERRTDSWERLSFNGVMFPYLPGRFKMDNFVKGIKQEFSLRVSANGLSASADLRTIMRNAIICSLEEGFYKVENSVITTLSGEKVPVHFLLDAARPHKGLFSFSVLYI